jgi:hypothetical protein
MDLVEFHPFEHTTTEPAIVESIVRAAKATVTFTHAGMDVFEFQADDGTHYVANRATAMRCMDFDRFVAFTSARMVEALAQQWAAPGQC